jgi:RND family efflux transporter MFP subunit
VQSAQNTLASTQVKNAASLQQAQTQVDQAQLALTAAQHNYALKVTPSAATIAADQAALTSALNNLKAAQVQASTTAHQYANQVALAQQSVTSAQHNYALKVAPASAEQIAADQASVESAKVALANAQQALALATLTSPVDGVVVAVNVAPNVVAPSGYAIEVGTSSPQVTASVTEADFPSLAIGQTAQVTITALKQTVAGTVTQISPTASTSGSSSVVTYTVVISLVDAPATVAAGMSADISITTASASDVIAVPSTALVGSTGNYSVRVLGSNGQLETVPVEVGLVTTSMVEIKSGIAEGDTVVIGTSSSRSGTSTTTRGTTGVPGLFPGGGPVGP